MSPGRFGRCRGYYGFPLLAMSEPALRVPGQIFHGKTDFKVLIEAFDLDNALWTPTLTAAPPDWCRQPGIMISENAAAELGVSPEIRSRSTPAPHRAVLFPDVKTEVEVTACTLTLAYLRLHGSRANRPDGAGQHGQHDPGYPAGVEESACGARCSNLPRRFDHFDRDASTRPRAPWTK